jgi:hypothetical protein
MNRRRCTRWSIDLARSVPTVDYLYPVIEIELGKIGQWSNGINKYGRIVLHEPLVDLRGAVQMVH